MGTAELSRKIPGNKMNFINTLLMLLRWKQDGWDVHPINLDSEFSGWF
jgi:hypothetical protein